MSSILTSSTTNAGAGPGPRSPAVLSDAPSDPPLPGSRQAERDAKRLREAARLRDNLRRRKTQARERAEQAPSGPMEADESPAD